MKHPCKRIFTNKNEEIRYRMQIPNIYDWINNNSSIDILKNAINDNSDDTHIRLTSMESYFNLSDDKKLFETLKEDQNVDISKKAKEILNK